MPDLQDSNFMDSYIRAPQSRKIFEARTKTVEQLAIPKGDTQGEKLSKESASRDKYGNNVGNIDLYV